MCHNTENWDDATFDHSFPMNHGGANGDCSTCHPSGAPAWTCENCHSMGEMLNKHEGIPDIAGRCIECHPNGEEDDFVGWIGDLWAISGNPSRPR
jgi:hypothetical protein